MMDSELITPDSDSRVKRCGLDRLIAGIPGRSTLLQLAARVPPVLRSRVSLSACAAVARRTDNPPTLRTNLGIASRFSCEIPSSQLLALFGKPALYTGERAALELAAQLSHHSSCFVDIGAHVGYFTFYVSAHGPAALPIYFVEADGALFAALDRNVRSNGLRHVEGFNEAIGDAAGTGRFYRNTTDSLSGSLSGMFSHQHQTEPIEVNIRSFADLADLLQLDQACVKVDVEGAEAAFLRGASGALNRIAYLIIEVLGPAHQRHFVRDVIARTGFQAYYINDYRLEPSADGAFTYRAPEYNWLFCRERPDALQAKLKPPLTVVAGREP
jgi:FkbM family methyltransferase